MAPTAATKARSNPSTPKAEQAKPEKKETVQQLKNRLRNEAEREVLDAHKREVIEKTEAKYKAHGLEYVRRLTDEEKAQKAIEEHLAQFPNLREKFAPQPEQQQEQRESPFTPDYEPVTRETIEQGPEFDGQ